MNDVDLLEKLNQSIAYYNEYASAWLILGISEGKPLPNAYINVPGLNHCDLAICNNRPVIRYIKKCDDKINSFWLVKTNTTNPIWFIKQNQDIPDQKRHCP